MWVLKLFLFCAVIVLVMSLPFFDDFDDKSDIKGPYCINRGCCSDRNDQCAIPILGTLCYCDQFCNATRVEDCCPDYWEVCLGISPPPTTTTTTTTTEGPAETRNPCRYKGTDMSLHQEIKDNCNICVCQIVNDRPEVVCENNKCLVDEAIIQTVNNFPEYGWTATNYSQFWGRTLDDGVLLRLGTLLPERVVLRMNPVRRIYDPNSLPGQFDAHQKWPRYITKIQDQGWCGSSWAISTAAVASDRYAIISKGFEEVQLSAQNLLSCDNKKRHQNCKGGHLDRAWAFARRYGLVDEDCFPYKGSDVPCTIKSRGNLLEAGCSPPRFGERKDRYRVGPAYRLGNETDIMYEITKSGPVQATMRVYHDFYSYRSGIYVHKQTVHSVLEKTGYLSVRIVGWGDEYTANGIQKYWVVANSWGTNWGDQGYFRIARGSNECEIESFVLASWPEVDRKILAQTSLPRERINEITY